MTETSGDRVSQVATETDVEEVAWDEERARVPGLTLLYHPDLERVGERTVLPGLAAGTEHLLSRLEPEFAVPGGDERRPLSDSRLSRKPVRLAGGEAEGSVLVDVKGTRTSVTVDGRLVTDTRELSAADVERGVVLLFGSQVVLLLHLLDPLATAGPSSHGLIGLSAVMARVRSAIRRVADLDVPVLLRGETGTGKELVARAIHRSSPRAERPWVAVNTAALPATLAATELFGAEKGAYTGSQRKRGGYFQRARGGTLFFDEIGDMPAEVQVQLLRCLETGEVQPVGAERAEKVDVRVISATDADLEASIDDGRFRAPLLHRLSGYVIRIPPLRERREDLGLLLVEFLRRELEAIGESRRPASRRQPWLPAVVVARLAAYPWPGNVRQLRNVVRQLVIANRGAEVAKRFEPLDELPGLGRRSRRLQTDVPSPLPAAASPSPSAPPVAPRKASDVREDEVTAALRANRWHLKASADALGIPRSSLYDLIRKNPRIRTAPDLDHDEIVACRERCGGSVEAMSEALEVSERALRRRMRQLGIE